MSLAVQLPWPPAALSPNARVSWQAKARATARFRRDCYLLCKEAQIKCDWEGPVIVNLEFCPPSKRRADLDNALASFKAGLDAVADALRTNDSRFFVIPAFGAAVKGGMVNIRLAP